MGRKYGRSINDSVKYSEHISKCKVIGKLLRAKFSEFSDSSLDRKFFARIYSAITSLKYSTSYSHVVDYLNKGPYPSRYSSEFIRSRKNLIHLDRLAIFYQMLGVDEGDEVIKLTREVNPNFLYPLEFSERVDLPIRRLKFQNLECKVSVDFSNKDCELTPEQIEHLRRLAVYFSYSNKKQ